MVVVETLAAKVESAGMDWAAAMVCRVVCGACGECEERGLFDWWLVEGFVVAASVEVSC